MSADRRPADRIRKLVAKANSQVEHESAIARRKARETIVGLDTELLDTLAGQRARLIEELRAESRRLDHAQERPTKSDTGELVSRALVLLQHYERLDALLPTVLLLRIEDGHQLTNEERQQLDGPVEDFLDRWMKEAAERRQAERARRRAARKVSRL